MTPSGVPYNWRKPSRRRPSATAAGIRGDVLGEQPSFSHVRASGGHTSATRASDQGTRVRRNRRAVCECYNGPMGLSPSTHTNRETPSGHASEAAAGAAAAAPPILRATLQLYRLFDLADALDVARARACLTTAPVSQRAVISRGGSIEISQLPLAVELASTTVPLPEAAGPARLDARLYDLGIVALRLNVPLAGPLTLGAAADLMAGVQPPPSLLLGPLPAGLRDLRATSAPAPPPAH